ncbi:MAG: hypothetical protein JNM56_09780 [Planctomycetia bacterium]|jgi:hypothetical protein|nr:hypothetical protein [Planctomycetia bacterium]
MPEVSIAGKVWREFVQLAERQKRNPQALAETVLREYLQRAADEQLLADSRKDARKAKIASKDVEELIRQYRREKARKAQNGSAKKADSGHS